MSKNNLKQVRENNIKYNVGKDVEIISTYSKQKNKNDSKKKKSLKGKTRQEFNINFKIKEEDEEKPEKDKIEEENKEKEEKEKEKEKEEKEKEKLKNENLSNELNNKYIERIKELEGKIKAINLEHTIEIEQKEKDIKRLVTTNTNLKNSLEILTQRLDKVLINKNNQKIKRINQLSENISEEDLKYQLEIKEKELKNQQQLINILKKDNKNIRNILNNFGYNENNINLVEKVNQQYKDILSLQKDFKEYKEKHSSSTINIKSKKIISLKDASTQKKNNIKLAINSISPPGFNYNTTKNKTQNKDNSKIKHEYHGLSSSFNYNKDNVNPESIFTEEEKKVIKEYFPEEEKYNNFINKISILEKSTIVKEKEMTLKIKKIENKLKEKDKEIENIKKESKEKDNTIIALNVQTKELKKTANELICKINLLSKTLSELDQKNQLIMKKNYEIKNTIFSIDGIIEAKSKEGNIIPIIKEANTDSDKSKIEETNHSKIGNNSSEQSNKKEKNKNVLNFTNSNSEPGSDNI